MDKDNAAKETLGVRLNAESQYALNIAVHPNVVSNHLAPKAMHKASINSRAETALAATTFGLLSSVGQCDEQKVSLPRVISRGEGKAQSEEGLMGRVCREGAAVIGEEEALTADHKFPVILILMLEAELNKLVLRRASSFTMRRVFDLELAAPDLGQAKG